MIKFTMEMGTGMDMGMATLTGIMVITTDIKKIIIRDLEALL